jgi:hypothetical protein
VDADDLIDRSRRLPARAEGVRVWKRQVVEEIAETRLRLHATLLCTVQPHYGRSGVLSEMIYRHVPERMPLVSLTLRPDHGR